MLKSLGEVSNDVIHNRLVQCNRITATLNRKSGQKLGHAGIAAAQPTKAGSERVLNATDGSSDGR